VREVLGEPLIASKYWRFDAFHMTDTNVGVVVFPPYVPVPAWTKEEAYALVSYAEDGRVADTASTWRLGGVWSIGHGKDTEAVASSVRLKVSGGTLFLTASSQRGDEYLRGYPAQERCRVVIGCAGDSYDAEVKIDGKPAFELGGLATPLASGLAVMEIAPGKHSVEVASISSEAKLSAATELVCGAGDRRYVALRLKHDDAATGYGSSRKFVGQLEVSGEMPEEFQDRGLLIWGNGRWLVPAEPGQ